MGEEAPGAERIPLIKRRFLGLHGVIDIRAFLSGWFHGAPFEVPAARWDGVPPDADVCSTVESVVPCHS